MGGVRTRQNAFKANRTAVKQRRNLRCCCVSNDERRRAHDWNCITKPASKKTYYVKRNIVEFCCGENSNIGQSKCQRDGCIVTRLTLEDDVTTNQGLYKAIEAVRSEICPLWASIRCTDGSPRQNINVKKPGGLERIKIRNTRLFNQIRTSAKIVANECRKHGGRIAIELPKSCEYWRAKHVKQCTHDLELNTVRISGCALRLTDR